MKAELKPLDGKYYGTEVAITRDGDDNRDFGEGLIQIWVVGNYEPSRRELDDWDTDELELLSDSHYETETSLEIAELLVKAVNKAT